VNCADLVNVKFKNKENKFMKKRIVILIIGTLLLIGATVVTVYLIRSDKLSKDAEQSEQEILGTNDSKQITYQGKEGATALKLLEQATKIETSGTGEMAFVTSINGVTADSNKEFWSFNINNEPALVGAGSYITKDSDTITWKLTSF